MSTFVKDSDVRQEQFDSGVIGWRCAPENTGSAQLVVMDVSIEPGHTALARMPRPPSSTAVVRVSCTSAPFVAA